MNPIAAIRQIILTTPALATDFGQRVRTGYGAQVDQRPYCLLWQTGCLPFDGLSGEAGLEVATVQIDVYADSMADANRLGRAVATAIKNFRRGKIADLWIPSILRTGGPRQSAEHIGPGADQYLYRVGLDIRVFFKPTNEE
jgi:hypothetical protein